MKFVTATLVAVAQAGALLPLASSARTGVASDNVTYIKTVPIDAGFPSGARRVGKYLYVAGVRQLSIYDVTDPLNPQLMSSTPIGAQPFNEDVDTNGKILLTSEDSGRDMLHVWDVSDKRNPSQIAELGGMNDHTYTCVLGCKWAYGSRGSVIDLRDPGNPQLAGQWASLPGSDGFDATEVAPGLVLTSTRVIQLLDARKDPAHPTLVASGTTSDRRLIHSNLWPRSGRDKFFLVQGETPFSGRCNANSGAFMTWDASTWRTSHSFRLIDEFRVANGTYTDGNPAAGAFGCTTMWFDDHPAFRDGGLVVSAFFEHGTRFLSIDKKGQIEEVGYFMPAAGSTIATYWITDEIVYAIDISRGIDILRFDTQS
jgi:hypothetical protein